MKKTVRFGAIALSAALALTTLTACGGSSTASSGAASGGSSDGGYEIGYVNLADTDVFCMARETALNAEIEGTNFKVSYTDGNNDNQKQIDQTNAFLAKGVDALILVPADSEAIVPAINAASSNGTPVICLGIAAAGGEFTYVGSQNYDAGYMQGEFMAENLPENANVLYCAGTAGLQHSAERREGFLAALEEKGR
ncbi:MAG: sugar ABC transporter substrate-binding protein, partial [Butyricicoccus sp.]